MSDFFENFENPTFQLRSSATKHTCRFDIWQGNPSINVWGEPGDGNKGPIFRRPLNPTMQALIKKTLKQVIDGSPDTRKPLVISKYDPEEKKFHPDYTMTFIKNGERVYQIQISYKDDSGEKSYTFDFMAPSNIACGSEAMNPADRSELMVGIFGDWMKMILPFAVVLTKRKYQRRGGNQNNNSSNNNNNSGNSGGGGGGGYFS